MNKHNESRAYLRKRYRGPQAAVVLGLAMFPLAEARADYQLAGRTTMRVKTHVDLNGGAPAEATITAAFSQATGALQDDIGSQDVSCPLTLVMHNSYGATYSGGQDGADDLINSIAEVQATQNVSGAMVNVVDNIINCGSTQSVSGCALEGSRKGFVITRQAIVGTAGGIVLAHEFGHTQGLSHDNNAFRIMDPVVSSAHREVTPFNCDQPTSFRTPYGSSCTGKIACSSEIINIIDPPENFASLLAVAPSMSLDIDALDPAVFEENDIALDVEALAPPVFEENDFSAFSVTELLDGAVIDRAPAELEDYFGDEDVEELLAVLFDPARREQHGNAVNFVGLISSGKDAHVQALIDYSNEPEAEADLAMLALGYIVERNGNDEALLFLADQFLSGPHSEGAAAGLTLTGDPLARDILLEAAARATNPLEKFALEGNVSENSRIEQMGLREHYLNPAPVREIPPELLPAPVIELPLE